MGADREVLLGELAQPCLLVHGRRWGARGFPVRGPGGARACSALSCVSPCWATAALCQLSASETTRESNLWHRLQRCAARASVPARSPLVACQN